MTSCFDVVEKVAVLKNFKAQNFYINLILKKMHNSEINNSFVKSNQSVLIIPGRILKQDNNGLRF